MVDIKDIQDFANRVAQAYRPERIILFGSYAYGRPTEDSDVDLLVVLPYEGRGVWKSLEMLNRFDPQLGIDLLVRTPEELRQRLEWGDFFLREITEKGTVLYESTHA